MNPRGEVIVWPHDHYAVTDASGEVRIVDWNGRIVARVGDDVGDRGIEFVDPESVPSKGEPIQRCPERF